MKKLFPIFILSLLAFVGCSDDDDKSIPLNDSVVQFIDAKYPGAKIRHAEHESNGLIEVEVLQGIDDLLGDAARPEIDGGAKQEQNDQDHGECREK